MESPKNMKSNNMSRWQMCPIMSPLDIPLIVSNILSYLDNPNELEALRQINSLWREEALKLFHKYTVPVNFEDLNQYETKSGSLKEYLELRKFHKGFSISLLNSKNNSRKLSKFKETILHFMENDSLNVKIKTLKLFNTKGTEFKFLGQLLVNLPNLVNLKFGISTMDKMRKLDWQVNPIQTLKFLFVEFSTNNNLGNNNLKVREICRNLVRLGPNIVKLKVDKKVWNSDFDIIYLQEMFKLQDDWKPSQGTMPFHALENINFTKITEESVKILLKFLQPIKDFKIYTKSIQDLGRTVEMFITKHAKTLECVHLSCSDYYQQGIGSPYKISFPDMPNLCKFEFGITEVEEGENIWVAGDICNLQELFLMGREKFEKKFPYLSVIFLKDDRDIACLLPPLGNNDLSLIFPRIKFIGMSHPEEEDEDEHYKALMKHLLKLFPNVNAPAFKKARLKN